MATVLHVLTETINALFPVVNFLNCVVTSLVLLLLLRHWNLQGSIATPLMMCGEIFSDSAITDVLLILTVK